MRCNVPKNGRGASTPVAAGFDSGGIFCYNHLKNRAENDPEPNPSTKEYRTCNGMPSPPSKHSEAHAKPHSTGRCAQYTREAVEAGGVKLTHHVSAKDYGSSLVAVGFTTVAATGYSPKAGDVGVIQPIKGHPNGPHGDVRRQALDL